MVTRRIFAVAAAIGAVFVCTSAAGEPSAELVPTAAKPAAPDVHHPPVAVGESGQPLLLEANVEHPELVKRALAVYHGAHDATLREVEFQRSIQGYVAALPADRIRPPWIAYALEVELLDGTRRAVFASRRSPHLVEIPEDRTDAQERAYYERLGGRRSVASATAEYVSFGHSEALVTDPVTGVVESGEVDDNYYRIEGAYTYRPLRLVSEFSMRAGIVRGRSPVPLELDEVSKESSDRFAVGLNYGAPTVRIRVDNVVQLEAELLVGITEVRVAGGAGAAVLIGDPYGTRLTLGFEAIEVFGNRFYSRLDVHAASRITLAPVVEATNMPHANRYGVRLLGEIGVDLGGGFLVAARGGYQARVATEGGPTLGATLAYAF